VDGALRAICLNDEREPAERQRVRVAPDEDGYQWAEQFINENPGSVNTLYSTFRKDESTSPGAPTQIPEGTRQRARRRARDRYAVAVEILRDARNHGLAVHVAGARVPFLLAAGDSRFMRLLSHVLVETSPPPEPQPELHGQRVRQSQEDAVRQLVRLLTYLEASQRKPITLGQFLNSEAHSQLVDFVRYVCRRIEQDDPRRVDGIVARELRRQLEAGEFRTRWSDAFGPPALIATTAVGAATGMFGLALGGPLVGIAAGAAGLAATAFQVG
jgi:hypothetical protein